MKPKTELALRKTPYVLISVAAVGMVVVALAMVVAHAATGDLFPLLFIVGMAAIWVLFVLLMAGVDAFDTWNKARIAELEMITAADDAA